MTAYLQVLSDDFLENQPLPSRIGSYVAPAFAPNGIVDSSFYGNRRRTRFRQNLELVGPEGAFAGPIYVNQPAASLVPAAGLIRTYEAIVQMVGEGPEFQITENDNADFDLAFHPLGGNFTARFGAGGVELETITLVPDNIGDQLWHYWSVMIDMVDTNDASITLYDGLTLVGSSAIQPSTVAAFVLGQSTFDLRIGSTQDAYPMNFMELLVTDTVLTAELVKYRTAHFRSLGDYT